MASTKFVGFVGQQNYRWAYTCEFCGKNVEKQGSLRAQQGSTYKTTTHVYVQNGAALEKAVQSQLSAAKAEMDSSIRQGRFSAPSEDDGQCPYCKKYQHWSPAAGNARLGIGGGSKGCLIGLATVMLGPLLGLLLTILVVLLAPSVKELSTSAVSWLTVGTMVLGTVAVFFVSRRLARRSDVKKKAEQEKLLKDLETVKHTDPRFIAWTDRVCEPRGMSTY